MNVDSAIRMRRSVRRYSDRPVSDAVIEECLRLALLAPSGGMAQAWSFIVVRDPEVRGPLAELVIDGGAEYFATVRPPAEGVTSREHARWAAYYAEQTLGTYLQVPVWIVAARVPRNVFPAEQAQLEHDADLMSIAFAMENLFVAARARGIGTVPTVFHWYRDADFRSLLDLPDDIEVPVITPFGYPIEFPTSLPPALKAIRRPWRSLVFDDRWEVPHAAPEADVSAEAPPDEPTSSGAAVEVTEETTDAVSEAGAATDEATVNETDDTVTTDTEATGATPLAEAATAETTSDEPDDTDRPDVSAEATETAATVSDASDDANDDGTEAADAAASTTDAAEEPSTAETSTDPADRDPEQTSRQDTHLADGPPADPSRWTRPRATPPIRPASWGRAPEPQSDANTSTNGSAPRDTTSAGIPRTPEPAPTPVAATVTPAAAPQSGPPPIPATGTTPTIIAPAVPQSVASDEPVARSSDTATPAVPTPPPAASEQPPAATLTEPAETEDRRPSASSATSTSPVADAPAAATPPTKAATGNTATAARAPGAPAKPETDDTDTTAAPSRTSADGDVPAEPGTDANDTTTAASPRRDESPRRDIPGHIRPATPISASEAITAAHSELGLSRIEIAEIIGTTPGLVDEWGTGASEPGRHMAEQIDSLCGVVAAVREAMSTRAARVWLSIPSPELDYYTPIDVLRRGELYLLERTLRERPRDITLGLAMRTDGGTASGDEDAS